jgi:hypothetical protein
MSDESSKPGGQVPEAPAGIGPSADLARLFATFRRELPRLLEAGHAGRYALIKGDEVVSIWDSQDDGIRAGMERFGPEFHAVLKIDPLAIAQLAQWDAQRAAARPR